VDRFLERLTPLADGKTQVPMKKELSMLTLDIISKVTGGLNSCDNASSIIETLAMIITVA